MHPVHPCRDGRHDLAWRPVLTDVSQPRRHRHLASRNFFLLPRLGYCFNMPQQACGARTLSSYRIRVAVMTGASHAVAHSPAWCQTMGTMPKTAGPRKTSTHFRYHMICQQTRANLPAARLARLVRNVARASQVPIGTHELVP